MPRPSRLESTTPGKTGETGETVFSTNLFRLSKHSDSVTMDLEASHVAQVRRRGSQLPGLSSSNSVPTSLTLVSLVVEAEPEPRARPRGFVPSTVNHGGQKFAVVSCTTPSLFGPSKRVPVLLDPNISVSMRAPMPTHVLSAELKIVHIGTVSRLVLGKVSQAWVLPGRLHPENLNPARQKFRAARRPAFGDIAGYCPFRCQFQQTCTAKTIRESVCP